MPLGLFAKPLLGLLENVIPDVNARREKADEMEKFLVEISDKHQAEQNAINMKAAESDSLFIAGPRPFILWTCGVAFAYNFVAQVFFQDILIAIYGDAAPVLTTLDMETLMPITMSLLGLGGFRTYEKYKGVSRESLRLKRGIFSRFRRKD
jgi:hypothetical protein